MSHTPGPWEAHDVHGYWHVDGDGHLVSFVVLKQHTKTRTQRPTPV